MLFNLLIINKIKKNINTLRRTYSEELENYKKSLGGQQE